MALFFRKSIPPENDERMHKLEELLEMEYSEKLKFWKVFRKYKHKYPRETLSIQSFYQFCGVPSNQFTNGIFRLCDCGNDQSLTFSEFVAAVTTYCMFEKAHMYKYCFFVFDKDGNGFIDKNEIKKLERCLFNDGHSYGNTKKAWKKALSQADANKDGQLDFEEFEMLLKCNPMMLYPAWQMQNNMMNKLLGEKWWRDRRHKLALSRAKKAKSFEQENVRLKRRLAASRKQAKIHQLGYIRYYFGPAIKWIARKLGRRRQNKLDAYYNREFPVDKGPGLQVQTTSTSEGVTAMAREFSLSPVKQVIRQTYSSSTYGVEQVIKQGDGGTPKVVKWSKEINEAEIERSKKLERVVESDRLNGLHRSGHWDGASLVKLTSRGYEDAMEEESSNGEERSSSEDDEEDDTHNDRGSSSDNSTVEDAPETGDESSEDEEAELPGGQVRMVRAKAVF